MRTRIHAEFPVPSPGIFLDRLNFLSPSCSKNACQVTLLVVSRARSLTIRRFARVSSLCSRWYPADNRLQAATFFYPRIRLAGRILAESEAMLTLSFGVSLQRISPAIRSLALAVIRVRCQAVGQVGVARNKRSQPRRRDRGHATIAMGSMICGLTFIVILGGGNRGCLQAAALRDVGPGAVNSLRPRPIVVISRGESPADRSQHGRYRPGDACRAAVAAIDAEFFGGVGIGQRVVARRRLMRDRSGAMRGRPEPSGRGPAPPIVEKEVRCFTESVV
jgi:hypothetical protein